MSQKKMIFVRIEGRLLFQKCETMRLYECAEIFQFEEIQKLVT